MAACGVLGYFPPVGRRLRSVGCHEETLPGSGGARVRVGHLGRCRGQTGCRTAGVQAGTRAAAGTAGMMDRCLLVITCRGWCTLVVIDPAPGSRPVWLGSSQVLLPIHRFVSRSSSRVSVVADRLAGRNRLHRRFATRRAASALRDHAHPLSTDVTSIRQELGRGDYSHDVVLPLLSFPAQMVSDTCQHDVE